MSELEKLEQQITVLKELTAQLEVRAAELRNDVMRPITQHVALDWKGGRAFGSCPFCGRPSLQVIKEGAWKCFSCAKQGNTPAAFHALVTAAKAEQQQAWRAFEARPNAAPIPDPVAPAQTARQEHNEAHRPLNHQSASAANSYDLRESILGYFDNHGHVGDWVSRTEICHSCHAWIRFGKGIVDKMFDELVAEGLIEVVSSQRGKMVRRKQAATVQEVLNETADIY